MSRYKFGEDLAFQSFASILGSDDNILGTYHGNDDETGSIVFTERGLAFFDKQSRLPIFISYLDIRYIGFPLPASDSITLELTLRNATTVPIDVLGVQDQFRDVFQVGTFLMKVVEQDSYARSNESSSNSF